MICVPRANELGGSVAPGEGCGLTCHVDDGEKAHFNIITNDLDYSRFCLEHCDSFSEAVDYQSANGLLCAPHDYRHIMTNEMDGPPTRRTKDPLAGGGSDAVGAASGGSAPLPSMEATMPDSGNIGTRVVLGNPAAAGDDIEFGSTGVVVADAPEAAGTSPAAAAALSSEGGGEGGGDTAISAAAAKDLAGPPENDRVLVRWSNGVEGVYRVADLLPATTTPAPPYLESDVTDAVLSLAKNNMLQARRHAQAAGASARAARKAYEIGLKSATAMGKAAANQTLAAIRKAAGEQAWEALQLRRHDVESLQVSGMKIGRAAADVYYKAKYRDEEVAKTWDQRAGEFQATAAERRQAGKVAEKQARSYARSEDWRDADDFTRRARNALALADEFDRRALEAHGQAEKIYRNMAWYDKAALAAEAHAIASAMPPGVPPPVGLPR